MTLWLILALMTAAAVFAVLWPLSRRPAGAASGHDVAVYSDQLAEIARDREAGLIGDKEAEAARLEISRRLLAAAESGESRAAVPATASRTRRRGAALVALLALPIFSATLYMHWGSPQLPGAPLAARRDLPPEQRSIETLVAQVEAHLERNPDDGRGWEVIAPVYMRMDRVADAVRARGNALRLLGATADREADLGEALVAAGNGVVTADAKAAFERALRLDPAQVKAQYFLGLAAEQDGRPQEAAKLWRGLLAAAPADAPYRPLIEQSVARVDPKGAIEPGAAAAGLSPEEIAAAQELTPEQRAQMVRGMVERLAERLRNDGSDLEGWLRLVRAYMVMGEPDKAREAVAKARGAVGDDPGKRKTLDDLAKGLGLEG